MNLIIVDDDPTSLKLLRAQLESKGHAVVGAHDGVDALALLERQRVDGVISDALMPRMGGYRLCYEIRKHARLHHLPIIIYTSSYTSPRDEKLALDMGADKYLKKPASVETIISALQEIIAKPRAAPRPEALQEIDVLKQYSERLVFKLEEKNTELQAQTEALRESQAQLQLISDNVLDLVAQIRLDGTYVYVSPSYETLLGYPPQRLMGMSAFAFVHPDDLERVQAAFTEAIQQGAGRVECRYRHADGRYVWVDTLGKVFIDEAGTPGGAVLSTRDITERRVADESRRLQSAALNAAHNAIIITDRVGVIEWVNPAFTQLTGYTAEEAVGKNSRDLVKSGKQDQAFYKGLWDTILAGRTWHGEIINRRKDGNLYTEDQAVTPILDASGAITHFIAIKKDTTERLQLEAQLRQSQKMEAIGQLASGVAHDFNNLLTVIGAHSAFLLESLDSDDPQHEDAEAIQEAGNRAAGLTRRLLAFSRKQILAPTFLDLNAIIDETRIMLERLLGEDIEIVSSLASDLGLVIADASQIGQVLMNLAVNARDAMPQGGCITITTRNVVITADMPEARGIIPSGDYALVEVRDTGVGMNAATQARLFEPFFTTKEQGKGTGLGLAMVYGIVKQSTGYILVESKLAHGTTFQVYLPRVFAERDVDERSAVEGTAVRGVETVLMIEDESTVRDIAKRILTRQGYVVLEAASGTEALAVSAAFNSTIHLVISDVVMPGMSGAAVVQRLQQQRPSLKVLFMSGYTDDVMVRGGIVASTVLFVQKPFTLDNFARAVRNALDA